MKLKQAIACIRHVDNNAMSITQKHIDSIIKPLGSLGILEQHLVKIAGITGKHKFDFAKKGIIVFCADNGIVAQNIAQSEQDVTAIVTENLTTGDTCLCAMARVTNSVVIPVDVGIARDLKIPNLLQHKISYGTKDFSIEHAMTKIQAEQAIEVGINLVIELKNSGYNLLATGEMGIGNTTSSAAVAAVLLDLPAASTTGRGAGLSVDGLAHKISIIQNAIDLHKPNKNDPIDTLLKVGGYDIAAMVGAYIGGAVCGIPVILDGFISAVAALVACKICPDVVNFILPSHLSPEPICGFILDQLGLKPPLNAEMRLGEGTGAAATFPLYDMMLAIYNDMVTFSDEDMQPYLHL